MSLSDALSASIIHQVSTFAARVMLKGGRKGERQSEAERGRGEWRGINTEI